MRRRKMLAFVLTFAMILSAFLGYLPSFSQKAMAAETPVYMAHLKSGAGNGNGHFGSNNPEAFALSDAANVTGEDFSFKLKLGSTKTDTRFRFVTKYASDTQWGYIAYDGMSDNWFYEFKNGDKANWPKLTGGTLPALNQNDVVSISGTYVAEGLKVTVTNETTGQSGTAYANNADFLALKDVQGKIGFGAATYQTSYTDIYFSDVVAGGRTYTADDYANWSIYKGDVITSQTWEPKTDVSGGSGETEETGETGETDESGETDPTPPTGEGTKWISVEGGSNNSGGHAYGNANVKAPALLLDQTKTMPVDGSLKLKLRPMTEDMNFGVFYTYGSDSDWFYVGYDKTSKWYIQYNVNGSGSYPALSGLPDPVQGEAMDIEIALSRETLQVFVNGEKAGGSQPNLLTLTEKLNGKGKFGVKANGQTKVQFADMTLNGENCMDDTWDWCAKRDGQVSNVTYTKTVPVTGTVKNAEGEPLVGAIVRIDEASVTVDETGAFSFEAIEEGDYTMAATAPGYQAVEQEIKVSAETENVHDIVLAPKAEINLEDYDKISSEYMDVYVGKTFPVVARYALKADAETYFRGQETEVNTIKINGVAIEPTDVKVENSGSAQTYAMKLANAGTGIDVNMTVKISVKDNDLTWEVISLEKGAGCPKIASIDISGMNLIGVDIAEKEAVFDGALASTNTTARADVQVTWDSGFKPSSGASYLYGFLTNGKLSAGLWSNSEIEGDKRVTFNAGADTMGLSSSKWYYESGDKGGQGRNFAYPVSELPCLKVCIAGDMNGDSELDWNDGAVAFRDIINIPQDAENIKDLVNYRIVMNFASMAPNPFLTTADNIKKVYLATDGLPQAVMLKGYGNEGHDSANSEYADVAERQGGIEDFRELIKIAHKYNAEIGIHVNAQEAYPEAKSFSDTMVNNGASQGWGWLDQSFVIDKLWDLGSQARYKRFVQLYDRINGTSFYSGKWENGEYVKESEGTVADKATIAADAKNRPDNMDFIYLDVWYQDAWETRQIVDEINALGWRFSTEFPNEGEYDSTWSHWATDTNYGGAAMKGYNSDIIRFLRNDLRDVQVLNHPKFGGTADNPLLGGFKLYGFEGWGGDQDFNRYIKQTFLENLPTKFLQHYQVVDWEVYEDGQSPVGNHEKEITLKNGNDKVVVTRNEKQRSDNNIERTIKLNGTIVLNDVAYLLPWTDNDTNEEKLYHFNLDGGVTTWNLLKGWNDLGTVVVYELSDQGRINPQTVNVSGGTFSFDAKAATPYVVVKGEALKTLKNGFGESDYVVDPGFNGYADGAKLSGDVWSGDIADTSVTVNKAATGDQRLVINNNSKNIALSTEISGLKAGTDYVAEFYVENESDAKTEIIVNTGSKTVSNYTIKSIAGNYVQCDIEHGSKMQRMQVSFTAESDKATLSVARESGKGAAYVDDIRIVEKTLNNFREDGSFVQDFESVVQGLYPFVLGSAQGVTDPRTHLSQLNAPYTQKGWNKRVIDDVIDGEWSLKHHTNSTGIIYQTIPQTFRFEPGKVYNVEFDYQSGPDKAYAFVIGDGTSYTRPTAEQMFAQAHETQKATLQVIGSPSGQTWIGLYEDGSKAGEGSMGQMDFVLDNLKITEDKDAVAMMLEKTELYLGESSKIIGANLDDVEITCDNEDVITIDREGMKLNAVGAGTAVITAKLPDGDKTFTMNVIDRIVEDIPREEYPEISASANTEESAQNEPNLGGTAAHTVDGKSNTAWHSKWSGAGFAVTEENPAVLTVDLGKVMESGGFKFQQRPDTNNGIVWQFSYRLLGEDGQTVVASGEHIEVDEAKRVGGAWNEVFADNPVSARYIEISVESGKGGFASIAEVAPINVLKVVAEATLADTTIKIGEPTTLELASANGTTVKGVVWTSSDETVVTIDENGVATGLKEGTAVVTATNAAGLNVKATITVEKGEPDTDTPDTDTPDTPDTDTPNTDTPGTDKPEPDKQAPTKPTNLKATDVTDSSFKLSWTKSEDNVGVEAYEIFVNGESLGCLKETSALIGGLAAGTEYTVTVKAIDKAGNASEAAQIVVKTADKSGGSTGGNGGSTNKPSKPTMKPVQTGDNFPIAAVACMMVLSGAMVGVLVLRKKVKRVR